MTQQVGSGCAHLLPSATTSLPSAQASAMAFSSGSSWPSNPRYPYESHPRSDATHRGTRASATGRDEVLDASSYINDLHDPLSLGPNLETSTRSFPPAAPYSFPPVDVKGMPTSTPHTRPVQALEPPAEDGPIYLHLPQYGGYTSSSGWSNMQ